MDADRREDLERDGRIAVLVWTGTIASCAFISACRSAGMTLATLQSGVPKAALVAITVACLFFVFVLWRADRQRASTRARAHARTVEQVDVRRPQAAVVVINGTAYLPIEDLLADLSRWKAPADLIDEEAHGFWRAIGDVRGYAEMWKSKARP